MRVGLIYDFFDEQTCIFCTIAITLMLFDRITHHTRTQLHVFIVLYYLI